jgi:4-diphosphocytidyl-2-C-methyl-D-erythritol kinase
MQKTQAQGLQSLGLRAMLLCDTPHYKRSPMPRITPLPSNTLQIQAPAKLNLGLRVFPLRPDGFHNIASWFVPISFQDTLTFAPSDKLEFNITGRTENIPTEPEKNLITKAATLLAQHAKIPPHARIDLEKRLPPGGGLGGGSSDAASTLLALNQLWNLPYSLDQLLPLAAQLGSDIPFFIHARPSLCTGRGEIINPLPLTHNLLAVLIIPNQGCTTKEVFQAFDAGHKHPPTENTDWKNLATQRAEQLNDLLINDLAPAAYKIAPWLHTLKKQAQSAIQQPIHLTGSGSTLFTLTGSPQKQSEIHATLTTILAPTSAIIPTQILRHSNG